MHGTLRAVSGLHQREDGMAKPTEGTRPLKGKGGQWLSEYIATVQANPDKQREIVRQDKAAAARITRRAPRA
jgi:hypothetical protein